MKVRVRFQRELETQMASQYTVCNYFRQRLTDAHAMKTLHLYFGQIYFDCILELFC